MIQRRELIRGHGGRPARLEITTVCEGLSKGEASSRLRAYKAQNTPYTIFKLAPMRSGEKADHDVDPSKSRSKGS